MVTHFVTLELDLNPAAELQRSILAELERYGEPLRWAIVAVDADCGKVQIEAVVISVIELPIPTVVRTV